MFHMLIQLRVSCMLWFAHIQIFHKPSISLTSRYIEHLARIHWQTMKWILSYLKDTIDVDLENDRGSNTYNILLVMWTLIIQLTWTRGGL